MSEEIRYAVPFFQVPNALILDSRTTVYHVAVFGALAMHANRDRRAWPSLSRLSELVGCSRRKVVSTIQELQDFEWLTVSQRWDAEHGCNTSNMYELQPSLQGGAHGALGVVHTVHGGSACGAPEQDPIEQDPIEPEKSTACNFDESEWPEVKAEDSEPKVPVPLSPMKDPISNRYQTVFMSWTPHGAWGSIPKERAHLKKLGKLTQGTADAIGWDALELTNQILESYRRMKETAKQEFWKNAPLLPSGLVSRWDALIASLDESVKDERKKREWDEKYRKHKERMEGLGA